MKCSVELGVIHDKVSRVAPFAGAWIEITASTGKPVKNCGSHP